MRVWRDVGMEDEVILGGMAPERLPPPGLPGHERRKRIRKTLNRWERPLAGPPRKDKERALQDLAFAVRALKGEWLSVTPGPDWTPEAPETAGEMETHARTLEAQIRAVTAAAAAEVWPIPGMKDPEGLCALFEAKAALLRERAKDARKAEQANREATVTRRKVDPTEARRPDFDAFAK